MDILTMLSFLDGLPVPLLLVDDQGSVSLRNRAWVDLENRLKSRAMDMPFLKPEAPSWRAHLDACLREGNHEFKDEQTDLTCRLRRIEIDQRAGAWITLSESDSASAAMENIQNAKLREMSEMAAGIAHEINNPLTVIYAKAHYLREVFEKKGAVPDETLREGLEKVCTQSERIFKIVNGIRSFSRDARKDPMIDASVRTMLTDTLTLVNGTVRDLGIEVKIPYLSDSLRLECRPSQLMQVFLNLINNAIDAIKSAPFPTIQVEVQETTETVTIAIADNGPGVSAENEKKIFTPFFTTKPTGVGTGIGLSISMKIVKDHGGRLWLDRKRGPSCFVIELPKHQPSAAAA